MPSVARRSAWCSGVTGFQEGAGMTGCGMHSVVVAPPPKVAPAQWDRCRPFWFEYLVPCGLEFTDKWRTICAWGTCGTRGLRPRCAFLRSWALRGAGPTMRWLVLSLGLGGGRLTSCFSRVTLRLRLSSGRRLTHHGLPVRAEMTATAPSLTHILAGGPLKSLWRRSIATLILLREFCRLGSARHCRHCGNCGRCALARASSLTWRSPLSMSTSGSFELHFLSGPFLARSCGWL